MSTAAPRLADNEVTILARLLGNSDGPMPEDVARYILGLRVGSRDRARMHDLAKRNQEDGLTTPEKDEMVAYARATTMLSILKAKARRTLGKKLKTRNVS